MTREAYAIITDSSCDIPKEYIEQHHIFVLPLQINMPEGHYLDGVDITPEEVYSRMPKVVPSTSQPSPGDIKQLFEQIKKEGYKEAIAVCMSSSLSGTFDVITMCAKEDHTLKVHLFDSHRLSMALGMLVMQAVEMNENGCSAEEILNSLNNSWKKTNDFFCMPTLSYLMKGGRIGLVAGTLGTLMGIIPIITINDEGRYFTFAKTRNYSIAIKKIEETIKEILKDKMADIAVMQGDAMEMAKELYSNLKNVDGLRNIYLCKVSPALGVHTGPGLVGVAYRIIG
jgi:DegV family protein with EDD domain